VVQVELAEKTAVLFTKDGDQHNNLFDMQCMWLVVFSPCVFLGQRQSGRHSNMCATLLVCYFFCRLEQEITDKEFYEDTQK
jgi:hypothetical protein